MKNVVILVSAITTLGFQSNSFANSPSVNWSINASSCQVTNGTASKATFDTGSGGVFISTGQTGDVYLSCPVSGIFTAVAGSSPSQLDLVFYDTDGTTDTCYLSAKLLRTNRSATEGGATLTTYDGTTNTSPDAPETSSPWRNLKTRTFTHTWNFDDNIYWIQVQLHRTSGTCDMMFLGATLSSAIL